MERLVDGLIKTERLTTAYLLRAICMGNITLFCTALSRLSTIPAARIEAMISKSRHSAFRAAYQKAGMPMNAFEVFSTALNVWQGLLSEPDWISRARMPYLVTRQLVGKYEHDRDQVVDELLVLLRKISSDMARDEARAHVSHVTQQHRTNQSGATTSTIKQPENILPGNQSDKTIEVLDSEFIMEFEDSIARALEEDIIEITDSDMRIPQNAANDSPIKRQDAQTIDVLDISLLSNAA